MDGLREMFPRSVCCCKARWLLELYEVERDFVTGREGMTEGEPKDWDGGLSRDARDER